MEVIPSSSIDTNDYTPQHESKSRPLQLDGKQTSPPTTPFWAHVAHLHDIGSWKAFVSQQKLPSSPDELDQATTKQFFVDTFHDTKRYSLYRSHMWLRKRVYHDGVVEWSLKRNFVQNGDTIEYEEIKGADNILEFLRCEDLGIELRSGLHGTCPLTSARVYTVRVNINQRPDVYFEIVKYAPKCYASFITHVAPSSPVPRSELVSKVFLWYYLRNRGHYDKMCKGLSLPSKPSFVSLTKPPRYLKAAIHQLLTSPALQPPEFDYYSLADAREFELDESITESD